jgi:hypothetical protein
MVTREQPKFLVVEVTDMRTKVKSYKVYKHPARYSQALATGFKTREEAEVRMKELEAEAEVEGKEADNG